jgi:hypothetical protein
MAQISAADAPPVDLPRPFSDDEIDQSFQVEDDRWSCRAQIGDWLILAAMIAVSLGYHLAIFALQPGLR